MTIRSITVLAAQRDLRAGQPTGAPPPAPEAVAAAGQSTGQASQVVTLSNAIPSDVAALYTSVVGVLAGVLRNDPNTTYLPLRWALYGGCLLATFVAVIAGYYSLPVRKRRLPTAEAVTALTAFAFWGLVVPESPLYVVFSAPVLPILVGLLTAAGAFVLTSVCRPWLDKNPGRSH